MLYIRKLYNGSLDDLDASKKLITTLNAHSYNTLKKDPTFGESLSASDILLPDGVSMVWASRFLSGRKIIKIAGNDLFEFQMKRMQNKGGKCFFLGSSEHTLQLIKERSEREYPNVEVFFYSPPFKSEFSEEDNHKMIDAVNEVMPDVLFIGMTAPKQEKWAYENFHKLEAGHICCIGAVFDFYAGTVKRAPHWMIYSGMEWFYRLVKEPRRMWKRYVIGNPVFIQKIIKQRLHPEHKEMAHYDLLEEKEFIKNKI